MNRAQFSIFGPPKQTEYTASSNSGSIFTRARKIEDADSETPPVEVPEKGWPFISSDLMSKHSGIFER